MHARLLGIAQDGGFPQPGCRCLNCVNPQLQPSPAACLAIVDEENSRYWLIDAPPQFEQATRPLAHLDLAGIFLTHAHIGHYTGLVFLGKEGMATHDLPVYCSPLMDAFLRRNQPWAALIENLNIKTLSISSRTVVDLAPNLQVAPITVPHRPDFTDTFAYFVIGPNKSLFYCPDIDYFPFDHPTFQAICKLNEYLLLDATFYSPDELPGRDLSKIPHPFANETIRQLRSVAEKTTLIHLNHSNPLLNENSPEAKATGELGFFVGRVGQVFTLAP